MVTQVIETVTLTADSGVIPEMNESRKCNHPLTRETEGGHNVMGAQDVVTKWKLNHILPVPWELEAGAGEEEKKYVASLSTLSYISTITSQCPKRTRNQWAGEARKGSCRSQCPVIQSRAEEGLDRIQGPMGVRPPKSPCNYCED